MARELILKNCRQFDAQGKNRLEDVWIRNGSIERITQSAGEQLCDQVVDVAGRTLAPGFIDVHIQGAGGADVLDGTPETLATMSQTLAHYGTTSFLATTVVQPAENNRHLKNAVAQVGKNLGGANLIGIHLEGPFINPDRRGGISSQAIYPTSPVALAEIFAITGDTLKMMTLAPELPGNLTIIKKLVEQKVVASFGHSDATYEETNLGIAAGITHVTHIFNAMPSLHHRQPGPLPAIFAATQVSAQIISDGHHLHPAIVRLLYQTLGEQRTICITDGVQAIGLPAGRYVYNGRDYESKDGAARYLDGTLIGTAMGLGQIGWKFMEFTGCSLAAAIRTITLNPAKLLGIDDRKGSIEVGKDADLVVLDRDYSVVLTLVGGEVILNKLQNRTQS